MNIEMISFEQHTDSKGSLVAIEQYKDVPFDIKRVYYIFNVGNKTTRGYHAHKRLKQVLICVNGSCRIRLDDGREKNSVLLSNPSEGLYLEHNVWREMYDFSPGTVLMVLASELYDEKDYIRNYSDFLEYVRENNREE